MSYPAKLQEVVEFLEALPEQERREALFSYAEAAHRHEPREDETYRVADERLDEMCLDSVGVFLDLNADGRALFRVRLGPKVQTLTRALATILCQSFNELPLKTIVELDDAFIPRIVGAELMRLRSRTVYYMLQRMQEAAERAE
ncbi:MAG: Fe-S metabolism protein SufE [Verrucomicrobiota bacterium]